MSLSAGMSDSEHARTEHLMMVRLAVEADFFAEAVGVADGYPRATVRLGSKSIDCLVRCAGNHGQQQRDGVAPNERLVGGVAVPFSVESVVGDSCDPVRLAQSRVEDRTKENPGMCPCTAAHPQGLHLLLEACNV